MEMQARDSNTLVADELLKDILNRPVFILSSQSDRQILRLQSEGLFYLYLVMGGAGIAFCVVFVRLASRVVRYTLLRNHSQEVLRAQKEFAQTTLSSLHEGVIVTDEQQRIRSLNHTAEQMTGWQQRSAYHRPLAEVYRTEPLEGCPTSRYANHQGASPLPGNRLLRHREGHSFAIDESIAPILFKDGQQCGQVIIFRNVEEIRTAAQRLAWMARHDLLTGLLNRCEFEKVLQAAIDEAERRQVDCSLCYFDLDHFRSVNDSCGSEAGDQALIRISALIRSCIQRETAQIGRVGNDEFAILLYQSSPVQAQQLAEQIRALVRQFQFHYDGKQLSLDLSYGIVPIEGAMTASDVLSNADAACFTQRQGGSLPQNSDQENLLQARREDLRWVLRIKQALQENRFVLYQQSIVPLRATPDRPLMREVLIRMVDPEGRIVPAGQFISVVNRHNLAGLIDRWVVERFFQWYCQNSTGGLENQGDQRSCHFCLNLFPQTISDYGFESFLETQLQRYPVNPQHICFEITESSEIPNLALAAQAIERLRRLGFRFALDDFGKGTSSFGYLKQLPVDYLKIDGYFIRDLLHNTLDETIVASLVQISRQMGIQTTAEYVNSDLLAQRLRALGVDYAQGFYLAEPEPLVASAEAALLLGRDWQRISPVLPSTVGQGDDAS
jgi:Amt family ammonium transporter